MGRGCVAGRRGPWRGGRDQLALPAARGAAPARRGARGLPYLADWASGRGAVSCGGAVSYVSCLVYLMFGEEVP